MVSMARHGRLQRISRFAIFFTGMSTLVIGGVMTLTSFHQQQQEAEMRINQNLKNQAQLLVDQFYGVTETLKNGADITQVPYVTNRAVVKVIQNVPTEIESMEFIQKGTVVTGTQDYLLEDRLLKALKKQINMNDLHLGQAVMGTFELSEIASKEGIFYATKISSVPSTNIVSTNNEPVAVETAPEKISVVLVDPVKALSSLSKLSATHETNQNAFLINNNGKVLAHTASAYVGTDLRKLDTLQSTIESLFLGAQTGEVARYRSIEGDRQQIAFVRVGATPFAIAVEQKALAPVLSSAWISEQIASGAARQNLGFIFLLIAGTLVLMSGMSMWTNYEIGKTLVNASANQTQAKEESMNEWVRPEQVAEAEPAHEPAVAVSSGAAPQTIIQLVPTKVETAKTAEPVVFKMEDEETAAAAAQFVEAQAQLQEEAKVVTQEAESIAAAPTVATVINRGSGAIEFASRISNAGTIEAIERELVDSCSKLTESPTLYFRYHRRNQNLILSAAAGAVKIQNHSAMQIYVRKDIESQIENLSNQGKVASVNNYAPMSKLMISNLNVAHFEAWAVTCDRSVNANGSQMMGVLVVMQAGFQSAEARPILGKMIREAGNYLYAQNNKLRSSIYQRTADTRTMNESTSASATL